MTQQVLYEGRYKVSAQGYIPIKGKGIFVAPRSIKTDKAKEYFGDKIRKAFIDSNDVFKECEVRFTSFKEVDIVLQYT